MREVIAGAASQGYGGKGESDLHSDLNLLALCVILGRLHNLSESVSSSLG